MKNHVYQIGPDENDIPYPEPVYTCKDCGKLCKPVEIVYDYGERGNYGVTGRYHHTGHYESDCCGAEFREVD